MSNTISVFYNAFAANDVEKMVSCYDDGITFSDPAFGELKGEHAKNMWRMLILRSKGQLKVSFNNVEENETNGSAHWDAMYTYQATKRKVLNSIDAKFEFKNGKIIKHTDTFDMWKWARQAFGWKGALLGWTPFFKNKVRVNALRLLEQFEASLKK
jgi:hypothetical protein